MSEGEGTEKTEREQEKLGLPGPPRREEIWVPEEGVQWVLEGLQRGDDGYWRGCGGCGGSCALVRSVCTVMVVESWTSGLLGLGLGSGSGLDLHFAVWVSVLQSTFMQLLSACFERKS